jgi:regulator of sirC expression with transglutaminase-like and TPR domain
MALDFMTLATEPRAPLDALALALAAEFRSVDVAAATAHLDALARDLADAGGRTPREQAEACRDVLGRRHGFRGNREDYSAPENSMLDLVLERRSGLPILLSVVYVEVARRAGIALAGVGLPGHYVVGHFGGDSPVLLDPFAGGQLVPVPPAERLVRPAGVVETVARMLNNLVASYVERDDILNAVHAARLRLVLPLPGAVREQLTAELRALQARVT